MRQLRAFTFFFAIAVAVVAVTPPLRVLTAPLAARDLPAAWTVLSCLNWDDLSSNINDGDDDALGFLTRVSAPTCVNVADTTDYLISLVALPRGFAFPLHRWLLENNTPLIPFLS